MSKLTAAILVMVCHACFAQSAPPASAVSSKSPVKKATSTKQSSNRASAIHANSAKTSRVKAKRGSRSTNGKKSRKSAANWRTHGQQKIDPQRSQEIQEALIREHYLEGEPSGTWTDAAQKAMEKYQAANGWQKKVIPDSRALIKLGLGPDHQHLLNPDTAVVTPSLSSRNSTVGPSESNTGRVSSATAQR